MAVKVTVKQTTQPKSTKTTTTPEVKKVEVKPVKSVLETSKASSTPTSTKTTKPETQSTSSVKVTPKVYTPSAGNYDTVKAEIAKTTPTTQTKSDNNKDTMPDIVDGVRTRKDDGTLSDYGQMLQNQQEAQVIASTYKKPSNFNEDLGMYGGIAPTYEAYVSANVPQGNNVVSREQWNQSMVGKTDKINGSAVGIATTSTTNTVTANPSASQAQSFDVNVDYGTAIANAKTPQEKALLEVARQAKIDAMKSAGFDPATQGGAFKQWYTKQQQSKVNNVTTSTFDDMQITDPSDKQALANAKSKYANAKTQAEKDSAHAEAEAIRAKYNYSGGGDGSQNIALNPSDYIPAGTTEVDAVIQKTEEYIDTLRQLAQNNADNQYNQTVNTVNQNLEAELKLANVDVEQIKSDYDSEISSIGKDVYTEMQQQKVNSTNRGILQSQQQLGLEQGINARAGENKITAFQTREEKIADIQTRIANIRSKASTDLTNAQLQRANTINTMEGQIAQNQLTQQNALQIKEVEQQNNLELQQKQTDSAVMLKEMEQKYGKDNLEDAQAHDKEMFNLQFKKDIDLMNLGQLQKERLMKLEFADKVKLASMDYANQQSLMAMDNNNKIKLMSMERADKEYFYNLDAQNQKALLDYKGELDSKSLLKEMKIKALQNIPGWEQAFVGGQMVTNKELEQASNYYSTTLSKLFKNPITSHKAFTSLDPIQNQLIEKITGKSAKEISKMKEKDVVNLFNNYANKNFTSDIQSLLKDLEGYKPVTGKKQLE